ncbi:MAG TPA: hypothetical protein VFH68_22640 [Polyangia bacterium]|nr:hypothetical protein [Polyangia bacterium]
MQTDASGRLPARGSKLRAWLPVLVALVSSFSLATGRARGEDAPALNTVLFGSPQRRASSAGDRWQAALGMRTSWIGGAGFDPFSDNDTLAQGSLVVTRGLDVGARPLALALGLSLDLGHSDATTRGIDADLDLQRIAVVLEPRYLLAPGLFVGGRLAPGAQRVVASLHDPSAPSTLATSFWTPSVDASLTAGGRLNPAGARAGFWLLAEGGYGWSPSHDLTLSPRLSARDASKAGATSLGTLAPRAPFMRISLALSY